MTTYLLHGGATSKDNQKNDDFFRQFTTLVEKQNISILLCYWAREKSQWTKLIARDTARILKNNDKTIKFHSVTDSADLFSKLPEFDVLYVAGGEAEFLEPYYDQLKTLKTSLNGKVFAGSSMGAFLASEQYVLSFDSQEANIIHRGLGLVPYQILCHWDVEIFKAEKRRLLEASSTQPILTLEESEFVKIIS